ncbi:MAG: group II intron reverse transcriptase/maturase [Candidatus Tectomicrobia bacterium]
MAGTSSPTTVSTSLQRIATLAREAPERVLTTLAHHIDVPFLTEAYRRTRKDGAVGADGQTAQAYAEDLETNLESLLHRFKSGTYYAPPVRRVYIPKEDGRSSRPLGIPSFEDKVLQRAVAMVLEAVYEQDFLDCSYGFRPKRGQHQALNVLWHQTMQMGGGWVISIDIKSYFDTIDHRQLRGTLDQRVRDGVIRRTIDKWLKAGVLENGCVTHPDTGVPQGSGVAPLLSNLVLHEVLDTWFEDVVKPRLEGGAVLVRFADDAIILCARERDAQRVMAVLPKRFEKYGLTLHPDKTRVIRFTRPSRGQIWRRQDGSSASRSFDLLGFTHYWGRSRTGSWVVKRKTASKRLSRALKRINTWCREHRHNKVWWQHEKLVLKLRGHYGYYGITGNFQGVQQFRFGVIRRWRKWLSRRSQRSHIGWVRFAGLLKHYPLPQVKIVHAASKT